MFRFLMALALLFSSTVFAETELQWWHLASVNSRMGNGPGLVYAELQPRLGPETGTLLLRSAVGYQVLPWLQLYTGFAWTPSFDNRKMAVAEGRLYQQVSAHFGLGPTSWSSRSRVEERALQATPQLSFRFRTQLRGSVPLNAGRTLSAVAWDEVFFHLNTVAGGPRRGFDQNRLFLGLAKKLSSTFAFELGYLHQHVRRVSGSDRTVHALYSFTVWNL